MLEYSKFIGEIIVKYILSFAILILIYILIYYKSLKSKSREYKIKFSLFYCYITIVLFATIMPFRIIQPGKNELFYRRLNLVPFRDIYNSYRGAIKDMILNVLMFIPFGFLISLLKEKTLLKTIVLSFLFSLFIETTQLLYAWTSITSIRTCDITDVITNTTGGIIGFLLYKLFSILIKKVKVIIF